MAYVLAADTSGNPAAAIATDLRRSRQAPDGRPPRPRRRDARLGSHAAHAARQPGGARRTGRVGFRGGQPPGGRRSGIRRRLGGTQLRAPSRRPDGGDVRARRRGAPGPGRRRRPAADRELQSQHPRQLGRLHPGPRARRPGRADAIVPDWRCMEIDDDHALARASSGRRSGTTTPTWLEQAIDGCRRQGRRPVPRLSPDRQGHAQVVGRHRHAHSRPATAAGCRSS